MTEPPQTGAAAPAGSAKPGSPDLPAGGPGRAVAILHRCEDILLSLLLAAMIFLAAGQILLRNLFETGFTWADPVVRVLVLWVALLGALAASRDDRQRNVDMLSRWLPERLRNTVRTVTCLATAAISATVAWHAGRFVSEEMEYATTAFSNIPTWVLASIIPIAFAGIGLRYLLLAAASARRVVAGGS